MSVDEAFSFRGMEKTCHDMEKGRFPGAVLSDEEMDAGADCGVYVEQRRP